MADRKAKLTKTSVEAVRPPSGGQVVVWDTVLPGFGIRVSQGGAKTFILQKRVNGKLVKRSLGRFGQVTAERARKDAVEMSGMMARGVDPERERRRARAREVTLRQAVEAYLADRPLKPRTVKDVHAAMKRFEDWSRLALTEIRPSMVEERYNEMTAGKASGAAAKLAMRYLRAILNFADAKFSDDDGTPLLAQNPVKRLSVTRKGWTSGVRRRSFVKLSELKAWVGAVQEGLGGLSLGAEARDCLMLGLLTGVRPAEALGLRWDGVDFGNGTLTFRDTKNGTDHELPLTTWLAGMLRARKPTSGPDRVFSLRDGTPLKDVRGAVARVGELSGVRFMPSDLRRTFVTTAERLDIGSYSLKRMLNHTIGGDVTSGYVVPTTERLREPMQRVEDWLLALAGLRAEGEGGGR
jgi:integrase